MSVIVILCGHKEEAKQLVASILQDNGFQVYFDSQFSCAPSTKGHAEYWAIIDSREFNGRLPVLSWLASAYIDVNQDLATLERELIGLILPLNPSRALSTSVC